MISAEDVQRLADAHENIRRELARNAPRRAAKLVCKELNRLVDNSAFWDDVPQAADRAAEYRNDINRVLNNLTGLIDDEGTIFGALGVEPALSGPILSDVYGLAALTLDARPELTPKGLEMLRVEVSNAADMICKYSKGPIRQAVDWVFSRKGARIIAGAAVVAGNGAIIFSPGLILPLAPLVAGHTLAVGWTSMSAGISIMTGDAKGVIDALKPEGKK